MSSSHNLNKAAIAAFLPGASAHFLAGFGIDIAFDDFAGSWSDKNYFQNIRSMH